MVNSKLKIPDVKTMKREELMKLASELGKDPSFSNRRVSQEVIKQIPCIHDQETFRQRFMTHRNLEMITEEFLENLKPL